MKNTFFAVLILVCFTSFSAMAAEKLYVEIDGKHYLRCQPVEGYNGKVAGAVGDVSQSWLIKMDPVAKWNAPECIAYGNELIFKDSVPMKNAICGNKVTDATKVPVVETVEDLEVVVTVSPPVMITPAIEVTSSPVIATAVQVSTATAEQVPINTSITTVDQGGSYLVTICGLELFYLEMYNHSSVSVNKRFNKRNLDKLKSGCGYEILLPAGHGYNFKFVSPVDGVSRWNLFTGYGKNSWEGNGTCTMPVLWGPASQKGAEIVYCNDPRFQTILERSDVVLMEYESQGILRVP